MIGTKKDRTLFKNFTKASRLTVGTSYFLFSAREIIVLWASCVLSQHSTSDSLGRDPAFRNDYRAPDEFLFLANLH